MRALIRERWRWFAAFSAAGLALRLMFVFRSPLVEGDSLMYGDIAKNWLLHGVYGISGANGPVPTYIRLPGYPAFLAAVFKIFGMEHYGAALVIQAFVELAGCFLIAAITWELLGGRHATPQMRGIQSRATLAAFALAALCPFTADYAAAALAETWSIFFTALAFYSAARGFDAQSEKPALNWWLLCGLAIGAAIMIRPDNGILLAIIGGALALRFFIGRERAFFGGVVVLACVIAFLAPWTARNWRVMHRFQPLAPRYANDPGEFVAAGFNRWCKTWIVDFISVQDVYWSVNGDAIDPATLPERAWGDSAMRERTAQLIAQYDATDRMSPETDAGFAALATERIRMHPVEYYLGLPFARIADMWLRPRTELLPVASDWWHVSEHPGDSAVAFALGAWNLALIVLALVGAWRIRKAVDREFFWILVAFVVVRSAFLGTLENPEPRYTLECFPFVLALAGAALAFGKKQMRV